jgi:hypothetical protein
MVNRTQSGRESARLSGGNRRRSLSPADTPVEFRVTSVGESPTEERGRRMRMYFITMSLRLVCIASLAFVRDWWVLIPALGAIILPYFAVFIANAVGNLEGAAPEPMTPQALTGQSTPSRADDRLGSPGLIVVDAPAERRASGTATQDLQTGQVIIDSEVIR